MKVVLSITVICFSLALCQGMCTLEPKVTPAGCIDSHDGRTHAFGSHWNTAECMECDCSQSGMQCCTRYGGIAHVPGCTAVVDPQTCKYRYHKIGHPSKPCP